MKEGALESVRRIGGLNTVALGAGPPLVTLHPGPGFDHHTFRPWLDPLAECSRLVYFDFRGQGASERPADWGALSPESMVADVETVRRGLGIDRMVLLGHCSGCTIALMYARRHPDRVAGLILVNGAPAMDFAEAIGPTVAEYAPAEQLAALERLNREAYDNKDTAHEDLRLALPLYFHREVPGAIERLLRTTEFSVRAWTSFRDRYLATLSCLQWLHEIDTPALCVGGAHDLLFPLEHCAGRMAERLPRATLHVLEESGHMPFMEEPGAFLGIVSSWVNDLRRG